MSDKTKTAIVWFRNDLRLYDNPALNAAGDQADEVICVYINETHTGERARGGASNWWLDKSLKSLAKDVSDRGGKLILRSGAPLSRLRELIDETGAEAVFWNRRYTGPGRETDTEIKSKLKEDGLEVESFNGTLLTDPWTLETTSGGYYKVFTPYWRALRESYEPTGETRGPQSLSGGKLDSDSLSDWGLHPEKPDWSTGFDKLWTPGEAGALKQLRDFLDDPINTYDDMRNRPDVDGTSRLSPHLHNGEISPVRVWRHVREQMDAGRCKDDHAWSFLSEIAWREFSYVLLFHNPDMTHENYNDDFDKMPWRSSTSDLKRWQKGQTGYPIVDAGMRQLWQVGWMHNRVRMICASFLTKHLLIHWSEGEDWFWDTLVDADPASNSAGWQWTAGSGADASPYFRVFNPITQGQKFDKTGGYVRHWCPELKDLPDKHLHAPWEAGKDVLGKAGVKLGETYPEPLIAHKQGRERALEAWETLKERRS